MVARVYRAGRAAGHVSSSCSMKTNSLCANIRPVPITETFPLTILPLLLLLQIPIVVDLGLTLTKQLTAKKVNDDCVPHLPKVIMMELK